MLVSVQPENIKLTPGGLPSARISSRANQGAKRLAGMGDYTVDVSGVECASAPR